MILLLQEFDLKIRDKKGSENVVADHISRILVEHTIGIDEVKKNFSDEQLFAIFSSSPPWFAHIVNYLSIGQVPSHWTK